MKIMILGAGGQLGNALLKTFSDTSWHIQALNRSQFDLRNSLDEKINLLKEAEPKVLINCAAYTQVDKAESEPEVATAVNGEALDSLSKACNETGTHLLHISTDFVFDGKKNQPYSEADKTGPLSVYGKSKLLGEQYIEQLANSYSIFRTSWLYSNDHPSFYTTMLRLSSERTELNVVADQTGTPTSSESLAEGIKHYLKTAELKNQKKIYHFSNQGACTWYDFAHMIFRLNKKTIELNPIPTEKYPRPAMRPPYSVLSKDLFCSELNYKIDHWVDALAKVL